jgi:hypothetical protein
MTGFLLDTNCISEINHPRADARVVGWFNAADERRLYLSVFVLLKSAKEPPCRLRAPDAGTWSDGWIPNCPAAFRTGFFPLTRPLPTGGAP